MVLSSANTAVELEQPVPALMPSAQSALVALLALFTRNVALTTELRQMRETMTAIQYAKEIERFHCLDGLKDGFCPACGGAVNVIDNGHGTGVRIVSRW